MPEIGNLLPVQPSAKDSAPLRIGERVACEIIKADGESVVIRIRGEQYLVKFAGELPETEKFRVEILKTSPGIEVKLLQETEKSDSELVKLKDEGLFKRSEFLTLAGKDIAEIAKGMTATKLSVISAGELRQLVRNGGLFLENKLAMDLPTAGDAKLNAGVHDNRAAWDGITRMQLVSVLLEDGFFSFFELDELDGDGTIHIRRERYGAALYMKMKFVSLGEVVLSISPTNINNYSAVVRTERDISAELSKIKIDGATVKWQRLLKSDTKIFDIKNKIVGKVGRFDVTV